MEPGYIFGILIVCLLFGFIAAAIVQSLFLMKLLAVALIFLCGSVLLV